MLVLAGEPEAQAGDDAGTVIELRDRDAKLKMDNIKRRDPRTLTTK